MGVSAKGNEKAILFPTMLVLRSSVAFLTQQSDYEKLLNLMSKEKYVVTLRNMDEVIKELSELRYSRTKLMKQQTVIKEKLCEVEAFLLENSAQVQKLTAQISMKDVLEELKGGKLTIEESMMLLDETKIWEYVEEDKNEEELDGAFNVNAPHNGVKQFFNPPCEWFIDGMKMPMFKAEPIWDVTWRFMKSFTPTSLHMDSTDEASGYIELFGCSEGQESLIQSFSFQIFTRLLCFHQYDTYRLAVKDWNSEGWICQIILK